MTPTRRQKRTWKRRVSRARWSRNGLRPGQTLAAHDIYRKRWVQWHGENASIIIMDDGLQYAIRAPWFKSKS
jgi:hypothetical protein